MLSLSCVDAILKINFKLSSQRLILSLAFSLSLSFVVGLVCLCNAMLVPRVKRYWASIGLFFLSFCTCRHSQDYFTLARALSKTQRRHWVEFFEPTIMESCFFHKDCSPNICNDWGLVSKVKLWPILKLEHCFHSD